MSARKKKPAHERHICAPESYPPVHDCGRPETCTDTDRVWGCEVPACPPADPPGSTWWVGEEREIWRRGEDLGIHNAAGVCLPWDKAMAELTRRGARLQYQAPAHPRWGRPRVRLDIGAPLVLVTVLPVQLGLWRAA